MTAQSPPTHAAPPPKQKRHLLLSVGILVAFLAVYGLSLFGFHLLARSGAPIKAPDLNATDDTVVLVRLEELKTVANRLTVKVLVIPQDSMFDKRLDVLKTDTAVRMDPANDLGDLQYPAGKSPAQVATTVEAHGDPNNWPFDAYTTDTLSAEVLVGTGDARQYVPARVEVTGALDGWDVSVEHVGEASQDSERPDSAIITLHRAKGPLIFDLGICLVLFSLPALAFAVAIQIALGKRKFVPPFVTWFAAMLFAVIPIRNFLPGAPPPGAWIDQALVIWVLIALVGAMGMYMLTWYRQSE
ncbi:DUF4436 domain-containing protein [Mycobacterium montefiorense]|uniref:DUF4436 domain-containing protein n=1 Tax=Mycobacterium montefiorense TaxID=154654 RepID=A0AA37UTR6_9MYCO|nr:DUF4436 domain-containing protein [Mycobacterium montefiorense]GBG36965.1 DUF4436 domain-containing protein [Mycobacterium montefiorense]GKU37871.1 DUF4436 domain-containing protein [Mycobacterium montefiorense]GKU42505.1 DUF4436 domain-containing protein [Mycobacterium montefiorense]GKU46293.1 DUF4436 domain-containing protein [Mycobacterium montefiorense]GKU51123.1 DUF4436 domain-containing protein [Mycobacterium montefiorense]